MEKKITKKKNSNKTDYQEIEIDLEVSIDNLKEMLGDVGDDTEEFEEWTKQLKIAKKLNGKHYKVSTLKEYFNLLETIDEITDGEYHIYNNGTYITDCYC